MRVLRQERIWVARLTVAAVAALGLLCVAPVARAQETADRNGVIFVHGYVGSGAQFESQKMRFTSNGYPDSYVRVIEYDSTPATPVPGGSGLNPVGIQTIEQQLFPRLDQLVAQLKAETGRPQVDLLAHSLGTTLMQDYLNSDPARAANVAHYVNIDGRTASSPPGGVRTLALWATKGPLSPPGRSITGATNVSIPDSTHVQSATSAVSFGEMYKFFNGASPTTTNIVPESGKITLSGKAYNFPNNTGLSGATVQAWPIDDATGQRTSAAPIASYSIDSTGDWGPVAVQPGRRYEFALLRSGAPVHHFYYEPFLRSDHLLRLLESDALRSAGGPPSGNSVAMVAIRYKELWGDQGAESDVLSLNGINVCNANTCPLSHLVNAMFAYDRNMDGKTDTSQPDPTYFQLPFVSGVDVYMPAQSPPAGKVTVTLKSRGAGPVRTITFPNFPATTDVATVQLNDFEQSTSSTPGAAGAGVGAGAGAGAGAKRGACVRRRRFSVRIRQPRHGRIVRVYAYIGGRRVKRVRGHRVRSLVLVRPAGKDNFQVRLIAWNAHGRRTVRVLRFRRCGMVRPKPRPRHRVGPRRHPRR
ncbi:MAG: alpha/beta hydrolase [Actinobacteria bacterium]|nr:MAG: alpha/beta hydrolase [Actinomycetota bacterium]